MRIPLFLLAAALWMFAGTAHAQRVTNCNDTGPGSLREVAQSAPEGSTVELRSLPCNLIVLRSGPVRLTQYFIGFRGPGWTELTVHADSRSQVFVHTPPAPIPFEAPPRLFLQGFTVSWGRARDADAFGGCIFAGGGVSLTNMQVHHCVAHDSRVGGDAGFGGAVFALGGVGVNYSRVHSNEARGGDGGGVWAGNGFGAQSSSVSLNYATGDGGGVFSRGNARVELSSISRNFADGRAGGFSLGGGLVWIIRSTFYNNRANDAGAGELVPGQSTRLIQSTVSGNFAQQGVGGVSWPRHNQIREILNSTITNNTVQGPGTRGCRGGGIGIGSGLRANSSIISGNTCAGAPMDIGEDDATVAGFGLDGRDNIIGVAAFPLFAVDTTFTNNPGLAPLANNGGRTLTHMPLADSPAIDAGNNIPSFGNDQRGAGFPRTNGARTDIGAVER